jgi:hypothetical protein
MDAFERKLRGGCQCGQVSYVATGDPILVGHCYCRNCQRLSGAGHSTAAMFSESSIAITGTLGAYSFEPAPGVVDTRLFCPTCGSQLMGKMSAIPGKLSIALGTLDDANALAPQVAIYVGKKAHWDLVDDRLRAFEGTAAGQISLGPQGPAGERAA